MKTRLLQFLSLGLLLTMRLPADEPLTVRPPEQLDQLLAPIALYPDALIALILPAATVPSDIVLAARSLEGGVDPAGFDEQLWDDSVKSLAHYPDVVKWMDQNLAWTKQVGEAFLAQPTEVMNAVQRLRARARGAGTLTDTPQQQVILEGDTICILPAQPDVIYIPRYDPDIVYISRSGYYPDPFLTFGIGYAAGYWLGYDCDWGRRSIWTIDRRDRERYWRERHDWRRPSYRDHSNYVHNAYRHEQWRPTSNYPRPSRPSGNYSRNYHTSRPSSGDWSSDHSSDARRNESGSSSGDRYQRPSSGGRSSPSNRRTESRPSAPVQPSDITMPDSAPTPPSPTVQTQQSPQSPSRHSRDRQDGSSRGREGRESGRGPSSVQSPPVVISSVPAAETQRQQVPQGAPQYTRERQTGGYRDREARAQGSPPSVQTRSAPAQPPPSASSRAISPDASQSRQSSESARSAPSTSFSRGDRADRSESPDRGDRFQR